jgi:23S rRNA pseudouridine2457 synthase
VAGLILFNKPYQVLSQFTDGEGRETLSRWLKAPRYRVAGRLDYDSEGLLLLTDDGRLQHQITAPDRKTWKTYWVQVEGEPSAEALSRLRQGVDLKDGMTRPAQARLIAEPEQLWPRQPPIRERREQPTSWLELRIREGRNRQIRRMTAAVGYPTLRLVREAVGDWHLDGLATGEHRKLEVHMPKTRIMRRHD